MKSISFCTHCSSDSATASEKKKEEEEEEEMLHRLIFNNPLKREAKGAFLGSSLRVVRGTTLSFSDDARNVEAALSSFVA